jgi:hypothetical protein
MGIKGHQLEVCECEGVGVGGNGNCLERQSTI